MITDNNFTNNNPPEGKLDLDNQSDKVNKRKRYIVNDVQLQAYLETKIETKLKESISFETDAEKLAFIKPGNILTFKDKLGLPMGQIVIAKIQRNKSGAIKLINPFGTETPWFLENDLLEKIDWRWISDHIIVKEYE